MANNPKGLGKGLAALLGDDVIYSQEEKSSLFLPISQVESCASQPRKQFDPESLADLADSIREHGIIQPLTVRKLQSGYYQIIAGERRWRAARMAGLTQVPAIIIEADDRKAMELAMIENLQREDLNPIEEAEGYQVLMSQYNMTQEETAQRVGKSRSAVANALRLLNLCPPVRAMVEDGRLTNGHARALLPLSPARLYVPLELLAERDALPELSGEWCAVLPRVWRDRDESQLRQWLAHARALGVTAALPEGPVAVIGTVMSSNPNDSVILKCRS